MKIRVLKKREKFRLNRRRDKMTGEGRRCFLGGKFLKNALWGSIIYRVLYIYIRIGDCSVKGDANG